MQEKVGKLKKFFQENTDVAVAFSGGVDSSYLLYAARRTARRVKAYIVKSSFQPQFELDDALRLATELDVDTEVIEVDVLSDADVASNPPRRCYYCKRRLFSAILEHAANDDFHLVLDGTNASDDAGDRPGMVALRELAVESPLRKSGLTKAEIRELSRNAGLFTWDKPAYACLATRIQTGQPLDERVLRRTEVAESFLMSLGFSDFRVRTIGEMARIQVVGGQLPLLLQHRAEIISKLKQDYQAVLLDLETRDGQ